jgi:hypothetical protein
MPGDNQPTHYDIVCKNFITGHERTVAKQVLAAEVDEYLATKVSVDPNSLSYYPVPSAMDE